MWATKKHPAELLPDKDCISCLLCNTLHAAHITSFPFWNLPPDSSYKVKREGELLSSSGFFQICPGTKFSVSVFSTQP